MGMMVYSSLWIIMGNARYIYIYIHIYIYICISSSSTVYGTLLKLLKEPPTTYTNDGRVRGSVGANSDLLKSLTCGFRVLRVWGLGVKAKGFIGVCRGLGFRMRSLSKRNDL